MIERERCHRVTAGVKRHPNLADGLIPVFDAHCPGLDRITLVKLAPLGTDDELLEVGTGEGPCASLDVQAGR